VSSPAEVLAAVGEALRAAKDRLNEVDSAAGDGDLGITADAIGRTLIDLAPEVGGLAPAAALRRLGTEIGSRAPSTFGTLLSMGLIGAERAEANLDAPDAEPTAAEAAARLTRAVETTITARGKASRGGKTLLDALGPAADALETAAEAGVTLAEGLALASLAAFEGAESTRDMEPTMGRQAWLAERARGAIDPGALAVAIALQAASAALAGEP